MKSATDDIIAAETVEVMPAAKSSPVPDEPESRSSFPADAPLSSRTPGPGAAENTPEPVTPGKDQSISPESVTSTRAPGHRSGDGFDHSGDDDSFDHHTTPSVTPRTAAAVGLSMVTPVTTPRGDHDRDSYGRRLGRDGAGGGGSRLDFSDSDAVVAEVLSPRGSKSITVVNEYILAIQKLEGRKESLWKNYAQLERLEGREVKIDDFKIFYNTPRNSTMASKRGGGGGGRAADGNDAAGSDVPVATPKLSSLGPGSGSTRRRPPMVPPLALHKLLGANCGGSVGGDSGNEQVETRGY